MLFPPFNVFFVLGNSTAKWCNNNKAAKTIKLLFPKGANTDETSYPPFLILIVFPFFVK